MASKGPESVTLEVGENDASRSSSDGARRDSVAYGKTFEHFLNPNSSRMRSWESFVILTIIVGVPLEFFQAAFTTKWVPIWVLVYLFDLIFLGDIILRFYLGYMKDGILITDKAKIRSHYLRRKFPIDVFTIIPIDLVVLFWLGTPGILQILAFCRLLPKVVRLHRIPPFFEKRESQLGTNTALVRTLRYSVFAGLVIHVAASIWYMFACVGDHEGKERRCEEGSWASAVGTASGRPLVNETAQDSYVISLYWSVATVTSTGYGDISALTGFEKFASVVAMIIGIGVFFGLILGGMASMLTNFDAQRANYWHRFTVIKDTLRDQEVPEGLQKQVIGYYEYLWVRKTSSTDDSLINNLPLTFHAEVSLCGTKYILDKAPMFKGLSDGFLRMLSLEIKPALYLPDQIIASRNEICHNMYYIQRGEVEVLAEDDYTILATLRHGKLFGEVSLIFSMPRTNAIQAASHCDLMVLEKGDLQKVLLHYPEVAKKLQRIAEMRCDAVGHLEERVRAGEGIIPACRSLRRSTSPGMKSLPLVSASSIQKIKAMDTFDIEEAEREWVTVHRGSVVMHGPARRHPSRIGRYMTICWHDIRTLVMDTVIQPDSSLAKWWEIFVLLVTLAIATGYPYVASFFGKAGGDVDPNQNLLVLTVMYIMDFILLFDIIFHLRTAVVTPNGTNKDFDSIREHYVKSWGFVFDVLAIIPLDLFCLLFPAKSEARVQMLYLFSLNRLIKFWRVPNYIKKLEGDLTVNIGTIRMFKFFIYISFFSHWFSCLWYLVACGQTADCQVDLKNQTSNFVFNSKGSSSLESPAQSTSTSSSTPPEKYIISLYWAAATMTSTGYGDISANTTLGRFIALVAMLIGLLLYGYCLSSIAATLANTDTPRVRFQEKLFVVQEFMKDHGVSPELMQSVISYLSLVFRRHRGQAIPGGPRLMRDMPIQLQQDIAYNDAQETLGRVPLFKDCDSGFLRQLSLKTHTYLFMPGDIIVYEGDMGREMYFIRRGTCEVLTKDRKRVTSTIGPGQYFGEVGLIFGDYRTATVRAASYCEVLMLTRRDLDEALTEFPLIAKQFKEAASNRDHLLELKSASQRQEDLEEIADTEELEADRSVEATSHRKTDTSVKVFNKYSDDYLEPFKKFSPVTRLFLKLLMSRVFLPSGRYFQLWEGFRVAISLLSVFTVTIQASFLHTSGTFWGINYFLEITFYIDMYLKFHSAFFNENKVLVTHPVSTAKHYFKTNFLIDLMACFPTELIAYCFVRSTHEYALHIYAVVRLNRLIQFYRVPLAFNYLESGVEMETGNIRKWKFFFYLVLFMHILACVWYFSACQPLFKLISDSNDTGLIYSNHHFCHNSSWTSSIESFDFYKEPIITQYFISLYWAAATGASVGYGDIVAKTQLEMVLALSAMIFGIVFFGYVIASVAASLANADAQRARYQEKLTAIGQYLKDNQVEKGLAQRVLDYYNYMWLRTKGVDTDSLFDGLPLSLKADVSLSLYQDMINNVPLFQNTEVGFQKMLAMCIKPDYYLSKEYIVKKHDFGKEMFFIHRGVVDVVSEDGQIVFDTMQAGRFFGEISLVYSCPRTASIRAQTNCDCFVLTKEDLDEVLTHYPSIKVQINQVAEERINAVRKRSDAKDLSNSNNNSLKGSSSVANSSRNSLSNSDNKEPSSATTSPPQERHDPPASPGSAEPPASPASSTSSANNLSAPPNTNNIAPSPNTNNNNDTKTKAEDGKSQNGKARGGEETSEPAGGDADGDHPSTAFRQPFPLCCFFGNKNYVETILRTNHFVLSPESPVVRNLSRLTCALAFVLTWTIIYQSAFQVWSLQITLFSYLCELVFLFEIYIKFHVSCADEYGELEKDFNKVYTFYLKKRTGFRLDLVAALPLDIFALCFPLEIRLIAYTFLRWVHLLRLFRVSEFFENWEKELNINMLQVRLTKTFVTVVVIIHFFASLWYFIACPPWEHGECLQGSWASALKYSKNTTSDLDRYGDCLYWAVATLTSTGYGDIHAHSLVEMIIASLVMVIGQLLNGSVLGNIASTLANEEAGRVEYEERLDAVKEQMKDMKLNSKLRNRVISYFDYLWMRNKGVDQHTLLRDAPFCLQTELALNINEHHLTKVPIFKDAEASFFRSLSLMLRPVLITPNDYIVRQGDVGDEMYFIHRGTVEVMDENNLQQVAQVLHEGDHFDDINLLYDVPRRTSVRACTHVNLQALSVHDLKQVLAQFPSVEEQVCRIGRDLYGDYAASVNAQEHFPKKFSSD
ncbi:uncharacterized protein [Apostichopus japonicus]|uniref:uncharacterized protein isoform X3 n=1 Tax=Stichopus japonicus TaxID=307972 RepID=UPI003AB41C98